MLKQQAQLFTRLAVAVDAACIVAASPLSYVCIQFFDHRAACSHTSHRGLMIILPVWLFLLARMDLYAPLRTRTFPQIIGSLLKVHLSGAILVASAVYLAGLSQGFGRLLLTTHTIICFFLLIAARGSITLLLSLFRRKGYNARHILIVGTGESLQDFVELIRSHANWGLVISGIVDIGGDDGHIPQCIDQGHADELLTVCKQNPIDEVVFSVPPGKLAAVDDHVDALLEMGITVRTVIDLYDFPRSRKDFSLFHGDVPVLSLFP